MLISNQRQFIFIHIYKNAGTSINNALVPFISSRWQVIFSSLLKRINVRASFDPQPFPCHIKAPELINIIGKEAFASFFSFAIVRNPWDWQVSLYKYMLQSRSHHQHHLIKTLGSFDEYIRWRCAHEVRFQRDFIYSDDNQLLVDFVGRFENLDNDFKTICSRIGIEATLPRLNASNTKPYREFYTNETRDLVRHTFDADISLLGYEF